MYNNSVPIFGALFFMKIAIQGDIGSYHYEVAQYRYGQDAVIICCDTFKDVGINVATNTVDIGIMAIANSIAGAILPNYALMHDYDLNISDEVYWNIQHQFICLPGQQLDDIHTISSHPMALLQCERFLSTRKHWHIIHDVDTAGAAALISKQEKKGWVAIASRSTAKYYGLEILAEQIQDVKENYTRFYVLEKSDKTHHSQGNKIAMCFTLPHQVGALERLEAQGIKNLGAIHRGFSSYKKTKYRNTPNGKYRLTLSSAYLIYLYYVIPRISVVTVLIYLRYLNKPLT